MGIQHIGMAVVSTVAAGSGAYLRRSVQEDRTLFAGANTTETHRLNTLSINRTDFVGDMGGLPYVRPILGYDHLEPTSMPTGQLEVDEYAGNHKWDNKALLFLAVPIAVSSIMAIGYLLFFCECSGLDPG